MDRERDRSDLEHEEATSLTPRGGGRDPDAHQDAAAARRSSAAQLRVFRAAQEGDADVEGEVDGVEELADDTGSPLPQDVRADMEQAFGTDFGDVRTHDGPRSAAAADAMGARAFTVDQDIHFNHGENSPNSHAGRELLAHELTHTVQQRGGSAGPQTKSVVVAASDPAEIEADRVATQVAAGERNVSVNVAATTGGTNSTVHLDRGRHRKQPDDDWQVTRPPDKKKHKDKDADMPSWYREGEKAEWKPQIRPDPLGAQPALGSQYTQQFSVQNSYEAPAKTKYRWSSKLAGTTTDEIVGKHDGTGDSTSVVVKTGGVGGGAVQTALTYDPPGKAPKGTVEDGIGYNVPAPTVKSLHMETENAAGARRPYFDQMLMAEKLVITCAFNGIDPKRTDHPISGKLVGSGGLHYVGAKIVTPGVYELKLRAEKEGPVDAKAYALPYKIASSDIEGIPIKSTVALEGGKDDRPVNVTAAKEWLDSEYTALFESQKGGLDDLVKQTQEVDPPKKPGIMEQLVVVVAGAALDSVTAGLGMRIANGLVKGGSKEAPYLFEMTKNFFKSGIGGVVKAGVSNLGGSMPDMAPHLLFHRVQQESLIVLNRDHHQQVLSNRVNPMIDELEKEQPGKGFEAAVLLQRQIRAQQAEARTLQYDESFAQWCVFQAKAQLGEDPDDKFAHQNGAGELVRGTDLGKEVSADRIESKSVYGGDRPYRDVDPHYGVLNIEIVIDDPQKPVQVFLAEMKGLNQKLREKVGQTAIKDLKFPVTAYDNEDGGFMVGRNEAGTYWGHEASWSKKLKAKGGGDTAQAAIKILRDEIGNLKITPRTDV